MDKKNFNFYSFDYLKIDFFLYSLVHSLNQSFNKYLLNRWLSTDPGTGAAMVNTQTRSLPHGPCNQWLVRVPLWWTVCIIPLPVYIEFFVFFSLNCLTSLYSKESNSLLYLLQMFSSVCLSVLILVVFSLFYRILKLSIQIYWILSLMISSLAFRLRK